MSSITSSIWKKITASTVTEVKKLVAKSGARSVLVIGENTQALTTELAFDVELMDSINITQLKQVLSRSSKELEEGEPLFGYEPHSYDLCIVSFALHQVEPEVAEAVVCEALRISPNALLIDFALAERNIELPSQYLCSFVEQFLHAGHWETYKHYIRVGALHGIAHRASASEFANVTIWGGGIRLLLVG